MPRKFKTVDYEVALDLTVTLGECLPAHHLARFIVKIVAELDLSCIYASYGPVGGEPYAPEILLGLLFYSYATGVFSSRKIEKGTYETIPLRFIAGGLHPDHDTINQFRQDFLPHLKPLFVQILLVAQAEGALNLGNISLDGSKIHADASKSKAISYQRLLKLESELEVEVAELLALGQQSERADLADGLDIVSEVTFRQQRLTRLAEAKVVLTARSEERYQAELSEYEAKVREREAKVQQMGRKLGGRAPVPPTPGVRDKDQYNFTDPASAIMKNSNNGGFDQNYNAQIGVDQVSLLIVANTLSPHPNDKQEALPTLEAVPTELGKPPAGALDNGYFSAANIAGFVARGVEPYIATGREAHHHSWQDYFKVQPAPPAEDASPKTKMAYKLQTDIGKIIYGLRKCTVEPVIGIIKEVLGFRQFSLRGMSKAAGEWNLVCIGFNLKRLHTLLVG